MNSGIAEDRHEVDRASKTRSASTSTTSRSRFVGLLGLSPKSMGKRKKNTQNVVKVDLGDYAFKESGALPVLVQHLSKDRCRIEQTVHQIPALEPSLPPAFNPRPVLEEAEEEDVIFFDVEPPAEGGGGDRVCSNFSHLFLSLILS